MKTVYGSVGDAPSVPPHKCDVLLRWLADERYLVTLATCRSGWKCVVSEDQDFPMVIGYGHASPAAAVAQAVALLKELRLP